MSNQYILNSLEDNTFKPIIELNENQFQELERCIGVISGFFKQFSVYVYFQLNLLEFDNLIKNLTEIPVVNLNATQFNSKNLFLGVNRTVFNLLSSYKFFIDGSETYLKRKYGSDSSQANDFIDKTRNAFDSSFAYRFLNKLRHYSQHIGLPIHAVPFKAVENRLEPHKMKGEFKLIVSRELLLSERDLLGPIVNKDLNALSDDINIKPLVYELGNIISEFEKAIFNYHKNEVEPSIDFIETLARNYKTANNSVVVMYDVVIGEVYHTFQVMPLPLDEISEMLNFKNWVK